MRDTLAALSGGRWTEMPARPVEAPPEMTAADMRLDLGDVERCEAPTLVARPSLALPIDGGARLPRSAHGPPNLVRARQLHGPLQVLLPQLAEQRRIVDLIGATDLVIGGASRVRVEADYGPGQGERLGSSGEAHRGGTEPLLGGTVYR
jgi:hypothetical protein